MEIAQRVSTEQYNEEDISFWEQDCKVKQSDWFRLLENKGFIFSSGHQQKFCYKSSIQAGCTSFTHKVFDTIVKVFLRRRNR